MSDQLCLRPLRKVPHCLMFVCLFCSCLSGWGFRTRDQLCSRSLRKVPHCLMFVCLFVYFVVVYQVGVPYCLFIL